MKIKHNVILIVAAMLLLGSVTFFSEFFLTGQEVALVNQAGLVRGRSQRIVKLALMDRNVSELIAANDRTLLGLVHGDESLNLPEVSSPLLRETLSDVTVGWQALKSDLGKMNTVAEKEKILEDSEDFFELTNRMVYATEMIYREEFQYQTFWRRTIEVFDVIILIGIVFVGVRLRHSFRDALDELSRASSDIASSVEEQEKTSSVQASSVNETVTTMDELEASFGQTVEQADASAGRAQQALTLTDEGNESVTLALAQMSSVKEKVSGIAEQILSLSHKTGQIGDITTLVADLANRTHMLALNAAVEAARAGDLGKGFGVVAVEIRKLADESKKATDRIHLLVEDIQQATNTTVMATEEGTKTVDGSVSVTEKVSEAFQNLADSMAQTFESTQQTRLNIQQQTSAVQQVVEAMEALDNGAKQTQAAIGQTQLGMERLRVLANNLAEQV
jgi:methyl-accepting chemotaxis protein